jgi:ssDNA-binding Zn-finger/Zn-ribbon topoisomerase 1
MDSILNAECKCGFFTTFSAGGGMHNFQDTCLASAIYLYCSEFFIRNYFLKFIKCPKCHKKAHFYDYPPLRSEVNKKGELFSWRLNDFRTFALPDTTYACPKCKQKEMRFSEIILFD